MPTTSWEQPWKTLYINKEILHSVFPKAGLNLMKQWLIFFLAIFCLFFFSSFPFHQFLSSQERNFWTINLSYTHRHFYFLTVSRVIFIFCHGNTWKIFMPSGYTEYMVFYFHPVLKWRGYDIQTKAMLLSFPKQHI